MIDAIENVASEETLPPVRAGHTDLSEAEARVLGCLIEKQRTTPDQYPLTLNGLRLACNQSTNREPVLDYDDAAIREALHKLERRGLVRLASGRGSRAPKYRHLLADALPMGADEQALMCVLMLRGAQTPGELKQRSERMHSFAGLAAVAQTLERLIARGLARRLGRRPGQKEERFCELLTGGDEGSAPPTSAPAGTQTESGEPANAPAPEARRDLDGLAHGNTAETVSLAAFEELRTRVERLERELADLHESGGGANLGAAESAMPDDSPEWAGP